MSKRRQADVTELKRAFHGRFKRSNGEERDDARAAEALARVDQQAIIDECDAECVVEKWDRKSDINGVPAHMVMRARKDIPPPPAKVYLIKEASTGKVMYFQPYKPHVAGRQAMTDQAEFDTLAEEHRSKMANERALATIKRKFVEELDKD